MSEARRQRFLAQAAECERMMQAAPEVSSRRALAELARLWRGLAEQLAELERAGPMQDRAAPL